MVFVVLLLQVSKELPLKLVDILYVAEDRLQLELSEHVREFTALTDVTLEKENRQYSHTVLSPKNSSDPGLQEVLRSYLVVSDA